MHAKTWKQLVGSGKQLLDFIVCEKTPSMRNCNIVGRNKNSTLLHLRGVVLDP